jgi:sugar/nucleoside kinase (ribokinase family)
MIGHIHSDHPGCCNERPGECARHIIQNFSENSAVFCNFGAGQICMGADFWEEDLVKTRLFQLNLSEIKSFFSNKSPSPTLSDILDWFRSREISVVITLDKFGSIASYKDGRDGVVIAWPREFAGFLDPTGAGDAFFSGLVHDLYKTPDFTFADFYNAIETATVWATYACGHFGGSSNCPDSRTIENFKEEFFHRGKNNQILTLKEADLILRVFDRMTEGRPL